jgi:RNA polymerase sigma-70 factor (ECF subfamily)
MTSGQPIRHTFEDLMLPHLDAVHGVAMRLSGDANEAEELVQETFMRAFKAFERYQLRSFGPKPWLLKILHNAFFTQRGRAARRPRLLDDSDFDGFEGAANEDSLGDSAISDVDWDGFDEELVRALDGIREEFRVVLLLWALEGLSYKEIAEVCDVAVGTVMSRLYRARAQLGEKLVEYASERNIVKGGK